MYLNKRIGVVVPAYNEARLVGRVIETMPDFVDRIIVVDDRSKDRTSEVVRKYVTEAPDRIHLITHEVNQGVGGAISTGYKRAIEEEIDVVAIMAGDAQMDPADLESIIRPVASGEVGYTKGNRLFRGESWRTIPHYRYLGNATLSLMTKIASGYWHIADSQTGYTAISLEALQAIDIDGIYKRYGMPNDILIKLNVAGVKVRDVSIKPVYNVGEVSGIKLRKVIPRISLLLVRGFFWRMFWKYVIIDFHPLVFFYLLGGLLLPLGILLGSYLVFYRIFIGDVAMTSALLSAFLTITGLQMILFGMWFDMEYNKHLR